MDPADRAAAALELKREYFRRKYLELLARRAGGDHESD
jgi:hypothetical protein